jgi:hypothetical protein
MARDITDTTDNKLRRGIDWVEQQRDDRFPARGRANQPAREWRPLDEVSRDGRLEKYRRWPDASR